MIINESKFNITNPVSVVKTIVGNELGKIRSGINGNTLIWISEYYNSKDISLEKYTDIADTLEGWIDSTESKNNDSYRKYINSNSKDKLEIICETSKVYENQKHIKIVYTVSK